MAAPRKTVFVSYAREDRKWAERLVTFLAPWIRDRRVRLWDDSQIQPGAPWQDEIENAIREATVAVLLVTPDFLASDFIMERELPMILEQARKKELRLAWIATRPSPVDVTEISRFQAVNDPSRPLDTLDPAQRDQEMVRIARRIADAVTIGTFAGGLQIIDETMEPLEAALEGRPEVQGREFRVRANYEPGRDRITFTGAAQTIRAEDLQDLPGDDREFIADLEDNLSRNYKRWSAIRKGLGNAGGALDDEIEAELARITKGMCRDLDAILEFLRMMHKMELEDHYARYRFICYKLAAR